MKLPEYLLGKQQGISLLGWAVIISMAGVLLITGLKLLPVYVEYYKVVEVMQQTAQDPALKGKGKHSIADAFSKRLIFNDINNLKKSDYQIKKVKGRKNYAIKAAYQVKVPLFGNLSLVAHFQKTVEVGAVSQ